MAEPQHSVVIPARQSFKAGEVCELLKVQPYVLRTWEQEFKELGFAKSPDGPRVYRRRDVELAVRIRQLVFGEGLTLAGARRRLESERLPEVDPSLQVEDEHAEAAEAAPAGARSREPGLDAEARARLRSVRDDLRTLLSQLSASRPPRVTSEAPSATPPSMPTPPGEPEVAGIREFTLEPIDVDPHVDDDERLVAGDTEKGRRKRRGSR